MRQKKPRKVIRLRRLRRDREWTQRQLAELVGISQGMINLIEHGQREPSLNTARNLAAVFNESIERILEYVEVPA